jgi:GntR family transcriptional repressor for pyruvate dehydrogenase complex
MRHNLHDPDAYVELDMAFHIQIAAMTRNTLIRTLIKALRATINSTINESMIRKQTDEQFERVQVGHETILACLERGDAEESGRAMTAHFADAVMSLVYGLGDDIRHPAIPHTAS